MSSVSAWSQGAPEHKLQRKSLSYLEAKEIGFHAPEQITGYWLLQGFVNFQALSTPQE